MCGITGKVSMGSAPIKQEHIQQMNTAIAHRGPDDAGAYVSPDARVGLGHRRLSVIDTSSAGHQPMCYKDRYWIVFNGEIYNFQAKRRELEKMGYAFKSNTDTEVILALYDKYKEKCLQHLRGMFAFAIYDEQEQILFCARDRAGQKPFKYVYDGKTFIFASELKAILTQPEYKAAPDYQAIHHYLTYQYVPAPQTGFQSIQKLEPAHYLRIDIKNNRLHKEQYWQLDFSHPQERSEGEWNKVVIEKLEEATQLQMVSDVPLGAFLSGGIDSSAVVAFMSRHTNQDLKTFSIGFPEKTHNELSYARQVAKHFQTDHTEFIVKPDTLDVLPELVAAFEEPYADSSAIPTYYLSNLARQHVTVALSGDGGDENFAGYARYNFHKLALILDQLNVSKLPGISLAGTWLQKIIPNTFTLRAERFAQSLPDDYLRRYVTYHCYFTNAMKNSLYQPSFLKSMAGLDSYNLTAAALQKSSAQPFDQALEADIRMYLPDDLLVKGDITSMMNSLEARSPFLDHKFLELTASIPNHLKLKGLRHNKYILKKSLEGILPLNIISRPKMGFITPIEQWFRDDMNKYLKSILLSKNTFITQHMFQPQAVKQLLTRHTSTNTNLAPPLWSLLTLELWLRKYFT